MVFQKRNLMFCFLGINFYLLRTFFFVFLIQIFFHIHSLLFERSQTQTSAFSKLGQLSEMSTLI